MKSSFKSHPRTCCIKGTIYSLSSENSSQKQKVLLFFNHRWESSCPWAPDFPWHWTLPHGKKQQPWQPKFTLAFVFFMQISMPHITAHSRHCLISVIGTSHVQGDVQSCLPGTACHLLPLEAVQVLYMNHANALACSSFHLLHLFITIIFHWLLQGVCIKHRATNQVFKTLYIIIYIRLLYIVLAGFI